MASRDVWRVLIDFAFWPASLIAVLMAVFLLWLTVASMGCASKPAVIARPVEVKVPVPMRVEVPAELRSSIITGALPEFVEPGVKEASVALTPAGVQRLQSLLWSLRSRISQWEAAYGVERKN